MASHLTAVRPTVKDVTMPLGENVKALRKERGWSQGDLATRVGADAGQISRFPRADLVDTRIGDTGVRSGPSADKSQQPHDLDRSG